MSTIQMNNNIDFTSVEYTDDGWKYTWAPGLGEVRVVIWGTELETTTTNSHTYTQFLYYNDEDIAPPVEVVPVGSMAISEQNLCRIPLQWHRTPCSYYDVEFWDTDMWLAWTILDDDPLIPVRTYLTPLQDDMADTMWRVTAIDEDTRESDPLVYNWHTVRPPDPPIDLEITCDNYILSVQ